MKKSVYDPDHSPKVKNGQNLGKGSKYSTGDKGRAYPFGCDSGKGTVRGNPPKKKGR